LIKELKDIFNQNYESTLENAGTTFLCTSI